MGRHHIDRGSRAAMHRGAANIVKGYRAILGALLVEQLDARVVSVSSGKAVTWQGLIRGTLIPAPSVPRRPVYGPYSTYFGGKNVVQSNAAATACLYNQAIIALLLNGTRPYIFSVGCFIAIPGATAWALRHLDAAGSTGGPSFYMSGGTTLNSETGASVAFSSTTPQDFESGFTAAGAALIGVSGARTLSGSGQSITADKTQIGIGSAHNGTSVTSFAHAMHLICSGEPSTAQITAIRALAKTPAEWNY